MSTQNVRTAFVALLFASATLASAASFAAILEQLTPTYEVATQGVDFDPFIAAAGTFGSATGDVTALLELLPIPPTDTTPGCDASDFAGFTAGHIALIRRGACTFSTKVNNADLAGAIGALIFDNVYEPLIAITLADLTDIPSLFITRNAGEFLMGELSNGERVTIHMAVPEPATLALLGLGLAGLGFSRRKQ